MPSMSPMLALDALDSLSFVATALPGALPAVSGFLHRIAGASGLTGTPAENWTIIGAGVMLHWGTGKIAAAWEAIAETRAVVEELRAGVKLAATVGLRVLREVKEGKRKGGGSFVRFAAEQAAIRAAIHPGRGQGGRSGSRAAHVMVGSGGAAGAGGSDGQPVRVIYVSRPMKMKKVAGRMSRRVG